MALLVERCTDRANLFGNWILPHVSRLRALPAYTGPEARTHPLCKPVQSYLIVRGSATMPERSRSEQLPAACELVATAAARRRAWAVYCRCGRPQGHRRIDAGFDDPRCAGRVACRYR
jgi:hypothetical protein